MGLLGALRGIPGSSDGGAGAPGPSPRDATPSCPPIRPDPAPPPSRAAASSASAAADGGSTSGATIGAAAGSEPAASPDTVTHGFTLRGAQLAWAILCGAKRVENRHFQMKPGWYAIHTGAKTSSVESQQALLATVVGLPDESALPHSSIVGAVQVTHALTLEQCSPTEPWAFGPVVNVIGAVCRLARPVPHRGALSVWRISPETLGDVRAGLATAFVTPNDTTHLPPPSQTPKVFPNLRKRKVKAEEGGEVGAMGKAPRPLY